MDYDRDGPDTGGVLARHGLEMRLAPKRGARSAAEVSALVAGCAGAIVSTDPFGAEVLTGAPTLRVDRPRRRRHGLDRPRGRDRGGHRRDRHAAAPTATRRRTTPSRSCSPRCGACSRSTPGAARRVDPRRAADARRARRHGRRASSATARSGRGRRARARLRGARHRERPGPSRGSDVELCPLDDLLPARRRRHRCTRPLTAATRHLIGARELARMRPGVDPRQHLARRPRRRACARRCAARRAPRRRRARRLRGRAAPSAARCVAAPNVVLTPHVAGLSRSPPCAA